MSDIPELIPIGFPQGQIYTNSGRWISLRKPQPEDICIEDIAHALSNLCRFSGHTKEFYSVAQHSTLMAHRVPVEYRAHALLHDAAEAYIADMPSPVKHLISGYKEMELRFRHAIWKRFDLTWINKAGYPKKIEYVDKDLLKAEWCQLIRDKDLNVNAKEYAHHGVVFSIVGLSTPEIAKRDFMRMADVAGLRG